VKIRMPFRWGCVLILSYFSPDFAVQDELKAKTRVLDPLRTNLVFH
jgi:hypothetical protein